MSSPVREDIITVVSGRVRLEEDGQNFIGRCPSCAEEMLVASPEKQIVYCFHCHKGANAANFATVFPLSALQIAIQEEDQKAAARNFTAAGLWGSIAGGARLPGKGQAGNVFKLRLIK